MAVDQLWLYNEAMRVCGERKLASLSEAREPRYLLDDIWEQDAIWPGAVLEAGQWAFGMRSSKLDYSPSVEPPFGYRFAFNKPTDWVRTCAMCSDEYYRVPLNEMADEAGYFFADLQAIYLKYVSNDALYGGDFSKWPPSFALYAGTWLAFQVVGKIKNARVSKADVQTEMEQRLMVALSRDAMSQPAKFFPPGSFTAARVGRGNPRKSLWNGNYQP